MSIESQKSEKKSWLNLGKIVVLFSDRFWMSALHVL
jgi:hypothetical protein